MRTRFVKLRSDTIRQVSLIKKHDEDHRTMMMKNNDDEDPLIVRLRCEVEVQVGGRS